MEAGLFNLIWLFYALFMTWPSDNVKKRPIDYMFNLVDTLVIILLSFLLVAKIKKRQESRVIRGQQIRRDITEFLNQIAVPLNRSVAVPSPVLMANPAEVVPTRALNDHVVVQEYRVLLPQN